MDHEYYATVQLGDSGPEVRKVQERLQQRGYRLEHADGEFGPVTERAVKKFQKFAGLEEDGIAGRETQAALWTLPITK